MLLRLTRIEFDAREQRALAKHQRRPRGFLVTSSCFDFANNGQTAVDDQAQVILAAEVIRGWARQEEYPPRNSRIN
jgi:hypothetical protein